VSAVLFAIGSGENQGRNCRLVIARRWGGPASLSKFFNIHMGDQKKDRQLSKKRDLNKNLPVTLGDRCGDFQSGPCFGSAAGLITDQNAAIPGIWSRIAWGKLALVALLVELAERPGG